MAATNPSAISGYVASWEPPGIRPTVATTNGSTVDVTTWEERAAAAGNRLSVNSTFYGSRAHLGVSGLACTQQFNAATSLFTGAGSSYFNNATTASLTNTNMTIGIVASKSLMQKGVADTTKMAATVNPYFAGFPDARVTLGTNSNGAINAFTEDGSAANVVSTQLWKQSADVVWMRTTTAAITLNSYGMAASGTTGAGVILSGPAGGIYVGSSTGAATPWYGSILGIYWLSGFKTDQNLADMNEWIAARYPLPTTSPTTLVAFVGDSYGGFGTGQTMFEAAAHATRDFAWCYNRCTGGAEAADIDTTITALLASITSQPGLPTTITRKFAYICLGHNALVNITGSPPTAAAWRTSMESIAAKCKAAGWIPVVVYPTMISMPAWSNANAVSALTLCQDLQAACDVMYAAGTYTYRVRLNRLPWESFAQPNGNALSGYAQADAQLIGQGTNFRLATTTTANPLSTTGNDGIHPGIFGHQTRGAMLAQSIEQVVAVSSALATGGTYGFSVRGTPRVVIDS